MCGIGGVYSFDGRPVNKNLLCDMAGLIRYRGPDDQGFYQNNGVGFFHNRLSIIDLETGHQPLSNENNTIWVILNGEIYNYLELRDDLVQRGHVFRTHTDTEVLVHLFEEHGVKCLDYLNGMFAFAVWDEREQALFMARDRIGIKPLYYYLDDKLLVFASEIKSLMVHPQIKTSLNYEGLMDYLTFQYTLNEKTLFENIKKMMPGHYMTIVNKKVEVRQYWEIKTGDYQDRSIDDWAEELKATIHDSVRLRLRSDVPLGAHLSGGIDSGSLVSVASGMLDSQLKTFSAGFKEGGVFHDFDYCQMTAKAAGTKHFESLPSAKDFAEMLPLLAWHMDEPAAAEGIFPQYCVSQLASTQVKVVLGGQGGDEIFGGYTRHYLLYLEAAMKQNIFGKDCNLGMDLNDLLPGLNQLNKYQPLMNTYFANNLFGESEERYFRLIKRSDVDELINPEIKRELNGYDPYQEYRKIFNKPEKAELLDRVLYYECKASLPALLQVEDRTSMAVSLESRVPLLDHRIVEMAFRMPAKIKLHQGQMKYILKRAMRGIVPDKVLDRTDKLGFPVPLNQWSQNQLNGYIQDIFNQGQLKSSGLLAENVLEKYMTGKQPFNRTLWGLLNLELWLRLYLKKEGFIRFKNPVINPSRLVLP